MPVQLVRFTTREADAPAVEQATETMLAALRRARPHGTRFAACKLADGVTFVNLLELDEGVDNPLPGIPECRAYQQRIPEWALEPSGPQPVTVLGSYELFG
ncbi:hypothetical protein [Prauserella flavalba]|uniref:Antibiotic biosynthesis monooxygenase n=1 Tax=Prauserella flavalba TaxID=1477506 RepID=A0A318M7R1_9PSEU|nr:hypothetical protein [Prauserella flavalba]PXY30816.1 hypothetical protein BA062_19985 [Prauserella flavalba]